MQTNEFNNGGVANLLPLLEPSAFSHGSESSNVNKNEKQYKLNYDASNVFLYKYSSSKNSDHPNTYAKLCPNTVVVGRGRLPKQNEGNKRLHGIVESLLNQYSDASDKRTKTRIVDSVISRVRRNGGTFVKHIKKADHWMEVSETAAREKVGYMFRDLLGDRYRSSSLFKVKARRNHLEETKQSFFQSSILQLNDIAGNCEPITSGSMFSSVQQSSGYESSSSRSSASSQQQQTGMYADLYAAFPSSQQQQTDIMPQAQQDRETLCGNTVDMLSFEPLRIFRNEMNNRSQKKQSLGASAQGMRDNHDLFEPLDLDTSEDIFRGIFEESAALDQEIAKSSDHNDGNANNNDDESEILGTFQLSFDADYDLNLML